MHSVFRYGPDGRLGASGVAIEDALLEAGAGTPVYLYSLPAVVERFRALADALDEHEAGADHLIAVALKANSLPALLSPLRELGAGAEAGSAAELLVAAGVGFPPDRILLSGVGKTENDLTTALDLGVRCVSVESEAELALLNGLAVHRGRRAPVLLRLNPGVEALTHPKIATGTPAAKFGMGEEDLVALANRSRDWPGVELLGVHAHVGSQIRELETLAENARRVGRLYRRLLRAGLPVRIVNVGGGVGIPYRGGDAEVPLAAYAEQVLAALRSETTAPLPTVIFEPGRALFGPAGALIVRVLHTKRTGGEREFCVVDGGMNDLLRPALYDAWHRVAPLRRRPGAERRLDVVGGVCETGDVFARDRRLPPLGPGDLLALLDAGAYGFSMASNYNLRPRPAEVVLADRAFVARPAETARELAARTLAGGPIEALQETVSLGAYG